MYSTHFTYLTKAFASVLAVLAISTVLWFDHKELSIHSLTQGFI